MTAPLEDAITQVGSALASHHWPASSGEARLEPVRLLFAFVRAQAELGEIGKDELMAAGIEFNRMILDVQGRRHNAAVEEANACFKAGRALAAALAPLADDQRATAEGKILDALAKASTGGSP